MWEEFWNGYVAEVKVIFLMKWISETKPCFFRSLDISLLSGLKFQYGKVHDATTSQNY